MVEKSNPFPMKDQIGSLRLETVDTGTKVTWTSKGRVPVPILGKWFEKKVPF